MKAARCLMEKAEFVKKMKMKGWPEKTVEVFIRDALRCRYCGLEGYLNYDKYCQLTLDHIIPEALGGTDDEDNLVVACSQCNHLKNLQLPDKIVKKIKKGMSPREILIDIRTWIQLKRKQDDATYQEWEEFLNPKRMKMLHIMHEIVKYRGRPRSGVLNALYKISSGKLVLLGQAFSIAVAGLPGPFDLPQQCLSSIVKDINAWYEQLSKKKALRINIIY